MLSERTIINVLILAAGLIVGPYLTLAHCHNDDWPLLIAGGLTFLLVIFFGLKNRVCALPVLGFSISGMLNFVPFRPSGGEIGSVILILYYVITYIALSQRSVKTGPRQLIFPITVVGLIIAYHEAVVGMHLVGGAVMGIRGGVDILLVVVAYYCGINVPTPSVAFLRRLPWYCVGLSLLSQLPFVVTSYAPSVAPTLYNVTSSVNVEAYETGNVGRQGDLAAIGSALQFALLAYFPINTWWRPERWFVLVLSILCTWFVINGGYRSGTSIFAVEILLGAWCYCSWRALVLVPVFVLAIVLVDIAHSTHAIKLSLDAQRSLSFLPGDWNQAAVDSAASSNDFRQGIIEMYLKEDVANSPLFGNGFTYDANEFMDDNDKAARGVGGGYYFTKIFVTGKMFHTGWISVYDAVGIVGSIAFVALGVNICLMTGRFIFGRRADRRSPLLALRVWIFCIVASNIIAFFTVFGDFSGTFVAWCAYAIILAHISAIERKPETRKSHSIQKSAFDLPPQKAPLPIGATF